jgi:hypothetical protein
MEIPGVQHTDEVILDGRVRLPEHVVYRMFAKETVVLNLKVGKYHGLNQTAGRMLEMLQRVSRVRDAAERLSVEYGRPVEEIQGDLAMFCRELADRGLIEIEGDATR